MNIVVLAGGLSTERDVSIVTAKLVCESLKKRGHKAMIADIFFGVKKKYTSFDEAYENENIDDMLVGIKEIAPDYKALTKLREQAGGRLFGENVIELCSLADIVFLGLHGADGENGKVQAAFDVLGIKYTGSGYLASALAMNKDIAKRLLVQAGVPMPKGIRIKKGESRTNTVGYPCVVKPCSGGSSVGVSIVNEEKDFENALNVAFEYEDTVLVEKYIKGKEISVGLLDGKALPVIEIVPKTGFYDYKNKYQQGNTDEICPARISSYATKKAQNLAMLAYRTLGLEVYGRVDFIVTESDELYCLEANTLPGMTSMSLVPQEAAVIGMSHEDVCEFIVKKSLEIKR